MVQNSVGPLHDGAAHQKEEPVTLTMDGDLVKEKEEFRHQRDEGEDNQYAHQLLDVATSSRESGSWQTGLLWKATSSTFPTMNKRQELDYASWTEPGRQ